MNVGMKRMEKLKLLFYGFRHGHIYGLYEKAKAKEYIDIVACLEEHEETRKLVAHKLGIDFNTDSYDEWLTRDIDAVAIGGKYGERGAAIIKALKAGKHVIADKPICNNMEELEEISRLSREKGLKVACMLDLRYMPVAVTAKKLFESGRMGQIRNVSFEGQHCIDYANRPSWYFEENMHGGTINDLAIHGIDLLQHIAGLEIEHVDAVKTWNSFAHKNPDFLDCAYVMARCKNGERVLADTSYSAPSQVFSMPTYWNFKFWCEKGLVTFCYNDKEVTVYEDGKSGPIYLAGEEVTVDWLDDFMAEIRNDQNGFTESVFRSTKKALQLQQIANQI